LFLRREPNASWRSGSEHTGGIDARPDEYERRVVAFFDRALLEAANHERKVRHARRP